MLCKMKIPTSFEIGANTINIVRFKTLVDDTDCVGRANYRGLKIELQEENKNHKRTKEQQMHTFCHEWVHWLFTTCEKDELSKDENLVNLMATFMTQSLKTMKFK